MSFLSSLFGFGGSQPRTQQVVQTTELPEEIAPFAREVLDEAKALYTQRMGEGYSPYAGETIAPLTAEQEQAMAGISGLVGTQRPLQEEALGMIRAGGEAKFTPEVAQEYMSPYQRAVTDIEKREAQRDFEGRIMPQFEKQAVAAGGMSGLGTRAGVQAGELGRAQMQRLGDIETRGLQSSYQDAQNLFAQQQQRERATAQEIGKMAPAMFGSGIAEQGALQTIGEQKQAMAQEALDEAYFRHLEKQGFPQEQLASYSGFVYGNPLMSQRTMTQTSPAQMGPSKGSQLLGLGLSAAKLYGMGGGSAFGGGGFSIPTAAKNLGFTPQSTGGRLSRKTGGGLSSLPIVYRQNGTVGEEYGGDIDFSPDSTQSLPDIFKYLGIGPEGHPGHAIPSAETYATEFGKIRSARQDATATETARRERAASERAAKQRLLAPKSSYPLVDELIKSLMKPSKYLGRQTGLLERGIEGEQSASDIRRKTQEEERKALSKIESQEGLEKEVALQKQFEQNMKLFETDEELAKLTLGLPQKTLESIVMFAKNAAEMKANLLKARASLVKAQRGDVRKSKSSTSMERILGGDVGREYNYILSKEGMKVGNNFLTSDSPDFGKWKEDMDVATTWFNEKLLEIKKQSGKATDDDDQKVAKLYALKKLKEFRKERENFNKLVKKSPYDTTKTYKEGDTVYGLNKDGVRSKFVKTVDGFTVTPWTP